MAIETELKLRIAPEAVRALSRHPALRPLKRSRARTTRLVSVYFDTVDEALATAGVALRLRRDSRTWLQTVKGDAAAGSWSTRAEFEWPVTGPHLDPQRFVATPFRRTLAKAERAGLVPRFTTDIARTTIPLAFADGTRALLCIDVGEIRNADRAAPRRIAIHEIELELETGEPRRLFELAATLAVDLPLAVEPASKAARGRALVHAEADTPHRAGDLVLPHDARAGAAFTTILHACLSQIESNARGLIDGDDPEWIHQMRIGVRRLRACLSLARRAVAPARIEPLRVEWRWLAQALGPARDLDVFVVDTLPTFETAAARGSHAAALAPALAALGARAGEQRREARAAARIAVGSARFVRLVLTTGALAASLAAGGDADDRRPRLARSARGFARPLLRKRHAALLALGTDLAHATPQQRHAARLAAKKLRYATEFFAPLFRAKRATRYRRALTTLQDDLGAWNDVAVATNLAAVLAGPASAATAALAGWAAAQEATRQEALARAWAELAATRPFWAPRR